MLEQQRDHQVLLVVEVAQETPPELSMSIEIALEIAAERGIVAIARGQHRVGPQDDHGQRLVQRLMVALEQLEARGEPRLEAAKDREVVPVLDLVMLLELPQQQLQMAPEPGPHAGRVVALVEGGLAAAPEERFELAERLVALQPEARERAEVGAGCPARARMAPQEEAQLLVQRGRAPAASLI